MLASRAHGREAGLKILPIINTGDEFERVDSSVTAGGGDIISHPEGALSEDHMNPTAITLTSNCQWAACRSCFAWSAAQPAVKTNWLIMTWCLSSSIFTDIATFPRNAQLLQSRKQNKKKESKCWLRSTPQDVQTQSSLPVSHPRVSSAAFSSNNNIFMSSPTTKRRAPLIGRLPQSDSTTGALIGCHREGFKFTDAFVLLLRDTADEWGQAETTVTDNFPAPCGHSAGKRTRFYSCPLHWRNVFDWIFSLIHTADWLLRLAGI